jgi:hypothetical protein
MLAFLLFFYLSLSSNGFQAQAITDAMPYVLQGFIALSLGSKKLK